MSENGTSRVLYGARTRGVLSFALTFAVFAYASTVLVRAVLLKRAEQARVEFENGWGKLPDPDAVNTSAAASALAALRRDLLVEHDSAPLTSVAALMRTRGVRRRFGNLRVDVSRTVFSSAAGATPPDSAATDLFRRFAALLPRRYKAAAPADSTKDEVLRTLSAAIGFDTAIGPPGVPLFVSTTYLADSLGNQVTFPGTEQVGESYDPREREWWQVVFDTARIVRHEVAGGDGVITYLTMSYPDRASDPPAHVRTLLVRVTDGLGRPYALAMDIRLASQAALGLGELALRAMNPFREPEKTLAALAFPIALALLSFGLTAAVRQRVTIGRLLYAPPDGSDVVRWKSEQSSLLKQAWTWRLKVPIHGALELGAGGESVNANHGALQTQVTCKVDLDLDRTRWGAALCLATWTREQSWRFLGHTYAVALKERTYVARVDYGAAPEITVKYFHADDGSEVDLRGTRSEVSRAFEDAIERGLRRGVVGGIAERRAIMTPPDVIATSKAFREASQRLSYVATQRLYFDNGLSLFEDVYNSSKVRAVIHLAHLREVMRVNSGRFLQAGTDITRIVLYDDPDVLQRFVAEYVDVFVELLQVYRGKAHAELLLLPREEIPKRLRAAAEGDVALVQDVALVTRNLRRTQVVFPSGEEASTLGRGLVADGYVTWRKPDLAYFEHYFASLYNHPRLEPLEGRLRGGVPGVLPTSSFLSSPHGDGRAPGVANP